MIFRDDRARRAYNAIADQRPDWVEDRDIQAEALRFGARCIHLYLWSPGESQWATRKQFLNNEGEWWFFR